MTSSKHDQITMTHILAPMLAMAFMMLLFFTHQLVRVMSDRDALQQTYGRQDVPFEQSQKLNTQFGGLVMGTKKLADEGNNSAKELVKRLKEIGVLAQSQEELPPAPVPVASEKPRPGPVKP